MPVPSRLLAGLGIAGTALAVVLIGALHVVAAGQVDPIRRTISEYALGDHAWMFDIGVLALAVGSALVLAALVGAGVLRAASGPAVLVGVWVLALVAVVVFEKADWSVGATMSGYVHRYASLVGFAALPWAALSLARRAPGARFAAWARGFGVAALCWLVLILGGIGLRMAGVFRSNGLPIGLAERGMALVDIGVIVVLALWAWRAEGVGSVRDSVGLTSRTGIRP